MSGPRFIFCTGNIWELVADTPLNHDSDSSGPVPTGY